ncbi:site-specific integrase [Alteromonas sediminis]|uniref:Site-specific integrase n=1 Tax=Alteromonas sediminis TaxID=2259342 RepID=A0A3N5Y1E4_9ALTE|nr:site-specific integrase [Alteromonas sediminis]RPJ66960.1 site-specific integrase [Alteromonas sediminis]
MPSLNLKITDKRILEAPPEINRISDTEIKGFHVRFGRIKIDGTRKSTYYFYYKLGGRAGKEANFKIAHTDVLKSDEARKQAKALAGVVALGKDPQEIKNQEYKARLEEKGKEKVSNLISEFVEQYIKPKRKRPDEAIRVFDKDVLPKIGNVPLDEIDSRQIVTQVLDPIKRRAQTKEKPDAGGVQANKTLSLLKQAFDFGISRGLVNTNPLISIKKINVGGEEKPKDRYLSLDEIKLLLNNLEKTDISFQIKTVIKILLLSGCRVGEVTLAEWSHIDFNSEVWRFPPENVKGRKNSNKGHELPLTKTLINLLRIVQKRYEGLGSEFVFPCLTGANKGQKQMDKRSVARAINRHSKVLEIEKFTPHDFRRTIQTHMASMGIELTVIEKILNHELQGMMRVYNKYDYMKERKVALSDWSNKVSSAIGGKVEQTL